MNNKYVIIPILIHIVIILGLFVVIAISGGNYRDMLLVDDGYYNIARNFVHGDTLLHKFRGPVQPFVISILFIFPESLHPFVRLLVSLFISVGVIVTVYYITRNYISKKQFLIGSLVFLLNPVYIHWTFRGAPELLLALFLGLFILCIINLFRTNKSIYLFFSALILFASFFVKPVFLFIPFFLILASLIMKSRKFVFVSLLFVIIGLIGYVAQDQITKKPYLSNQSEYAKTHDYKHKIFLINDSFWTDYVLKTKQFYKPTVNAYDEEYKNGKPIGEYIDIWIRNFYQEFPNSNLIHMNLYFVYTEPLLVAQKLLVSPLFYFSMSARQLETFVKLLFSLVSIILAVLGLRAVTREPEHKSEIILIISIIVGFIALHLVTHAMNRYSLPVLPYLYIWAGIPLMQLFKRIRNALKHQAVTVTHGE